MDSRRGPGRPGGQRRSGLHTMNTTKCKCPNCGTEFDIPSTVAAAVLGAKGGSATGPTKARKLTRKQAQAMRAGKSRV